MSRNIPSVKRWFLRYYQDGKLIYFVEVPAPTKTLAKLVATDRMLGNEKWFQAWQFADKVTYTTYKRCNPKE